MRKCVIIAEYWPGTILLVPRYAPTERLGLLLVDVEMLVIRCIRFAVAKTNQG